MNIITGCGDDLLFGVAVGSFIGFWGCILFILLCRPFGKFIARLVE